MTNSGRSRGLTNPQRDAVAAPTGPVLVEGGPGTGKTLVLAARMAWLLTQDVDARAMLLLTPNMRLAEETRRTLPSTLRLLTERVTREASEAVQVVSIQGLAESFLRRLGPNSVGISSEFNHWSHQESEEITKGLLSASNLHGRVSDGDIPDVLRWHRFRRSRLPETEVPGIPGLWNEIVELYEQEKRRQTALDEEDIALLAIKAIEGNLDALRLFQERRRSHFLVDDFQNLTQPQYRLLQVLAGTNGSVVAAGERNQCIGTWWGADASLLNRFKGDNPGCKHVKLSINFRSTEALHGFSARLASIPPLDTLPPGTGKGDAISGGTPSTKPRLLRFHGSRLSMYEYLGKRIQSDMEKGQPLDDLAILMRRLSSIKVLGTILGRYGIPYHVLAQDSSREVIPPREGLALSTFHGAQGREWGHVFIADVDDDIVPGPIPPTNSEWIAEERRLLYVAATRAAENLDLIYSTRNGMARESRFLIVARDLLNVEDIPLAPSEK